MSSRYAYCSPRECTQNHKSNRNLQLFFPTIQPGILAHFELVPTCCALIGHQRITLHRVILASLADFIPRTPYSIRHEATAVGIAKLNKITGWVYLLSRHSNQDYPGTVPWFGQQVSMYSDLKKHVEI